MKRGFKMGILLSLLVFDLSAQSSGYYRRLDYRANDPFVFCTQGQDPKINPAPCWKPMPPYTGAFMYMPYCRPFNPYGKDWTQDDKRSFSQYLSVCPQAINSGQWEGAGRPEQTPYDH